MAITGGTGMRHRVRVAVGESVGGLPREFWWLWTSTLVNRLGSFVVTFMSLYLVVERGYSASFAGLVAALYGLGGVISSIVGGVLADRVGRRPTLLIAQVATAASVAVLGFMTHPVGIAAMAFLVGAASNGSRPATQAMMADLVPPKDRVRAFSLNYWALNFGFAVSAAGAGFIADISYHACFLLEAAMTLICAVLVFLRIPETRPQPAPGEEAGALGGTKSDERAVGLRTVLGDGRFMGVVGLCFLMALMFQQGSVGLPVSMGNSGFTPADYGLAIAVNGVLIVLLQIPVTRYIEHRDPRRLLVLSALVTGYGFALTAFAGSIGAFALTVCVWTLAEMINAPTQSSLVVRLSPVHGRGRYQGVYTMSWSVAGLVAPLGSGLVIDHFGSDWLWLGCAVLGTLTAAGYWLLMRDLPSGTEPVAPRTTEPVAPRTKVAPSPVAREVTPLPADSGSRMPC
ncbi:MFS transporter [Streptomyces sp. NA04227]|uniref:MDR family MFS transporter n=1 Tax=Streptomyces sp. NA04227 TaxID=2742136 RepID=UPI0015907DBD|nr:MFS transporter [Streptomyces sp. NA04227]QKW08248.1 MFS transporter [Streptomyces sp. NA04227]